MAEINELWRCENIGFSQTNAFFTGSLERINKMHLSLLPAFVILLVLPSIATAVFWLSPVSQRYRAARWLVAPCLYLGVAVFGLIVISSRSHHFSLFLSYLG